MKNYQKAELIAKNLPTGSYAAGCPVDHADQYTVSTRRNGYYESWNRIPNGCAQCEIAM